MAARRAMRALRLRTLLSLWLGLTGCAADTAERGDDPDEIGGFLAPLSTPCAFDAKQRTMTVVVESGEQLTLTRRKDGALLVNGDVCGKATVSATKVISITENAGAPGDEDVVLDMTPGLIGLGANTGPGIRVALGSGDDSLAIRTGDGADKVSMGGAGIMLNGDTYVDVTVTSSGTVAYSISLAKGNDTFTAQGTSARDTPFPDPVVVTGGDGDDKLTGGNGDDQLSGGNGNDWLKGGLGDDVCAGGAGDDVYDESRPASGTNGNDRYTDTAGTKDKLDYSTRTSALVIDIEPAGPGSNDDGELAVGEADQVDPGIDILLGGSGSDQLSGDDGANTISGGAGDDVIAGGAGADTLSGDVGNDTFDEGSAPNGADVFKGGAGIDTIDYSARSTGVTVTMDGKAADDGDTASHEGDRIPLDIENCLGGSGADDITGNTSDNVLAGGAGADVLRGGAGRDRFDEGDSANGGDTFLGGAGIDIIDYSARSQPLIVTMDGAAANDGESNEHDNVTGDIEVIQGGTAGDDLTGTPRADEINGGDGDDVLHGGAGDDTISGEAGNDTLYGEAGDDTLDGGDDVDTLDCGPDDDISFDGETTIQCEI